MEAWQVYDATISELLAQLDVLSSSPSSVDGPRYTLPLDVSAGRGEKLHVRVKAMLVVKW